MQLTFLQEDLAKALKHQQPALLKRLPASGIFSPPAPAQAEAREEEKAPGAFRSISEAADALGVPQHVLRFWESRFTQIRPLKTRGSRRYYRPEDMETLFRIKDLLYTKGYTIKGAQQAFRCGETTAAVRHESAAPPAALTDHERSRLAVIRRELMAIQEILKPYVASSA